MSCFKWHHAFHPNVVKLINLIFTNIHVIPVFHVIKTDYFFEVLSASYWDPMYPKHGLQSNCKLVEEIPKKKEKSQVLAEENWCTGNGKSEKLRKS